MKTLYYNGKIYTGKNFINNFVVEDGIFKDINKENINDQYDERIDLNGQFVCAGFNDSHLHLLNYGYSLKMAKLYLHTTSLKEMIEYGKTFLKDNPVREGMWLQGRGWNQRLLLVYMILNYIYQIENYKK